MNVLNTYGGGWNAFLVVVAIFLGAFAVVCILAAIFDDITNLIGTVCFGLLATLFVALAHTPVTHEVTLNPGAVIDATKYEIVEQRGQIYVIEEREAANE